MRDETELTADPTDAQTGAVGVVGDAPRLPEAAPPPTPPPAPDPATDAAIVEIEEPPVPEQSRAPVGFFVLMLLIVGAIAVIAAIARPWETSPQDPVTLDEPTATTPSTQPATTQPATTQPATTTAVAASPTTTLVVAPLPRSETDAAVAEGADAGPFDAAADACKTEQRTISVAVEAYEIATGDLPADPDDLVAGGMLEAAPGGWSTRWTFTEGTPEPTVVPVPGGPCDL